MKKISWTLFTTLLLISAALYNGFPLVTSDSGVYILSGFKKFVPVDRPITYGLFVRHSSLAVSLWFTIIFQSLILSYLLWLTLNEFIDTSIGRTSKLLIIIFLISCTGLSWYSSQIMPDIFTGIGILCMGLLLLSTGSLLRNILLSIFLLGAGLMHNSNMLIFSFLLLGLLPVLFMTKFAKTAIIKKGRYVYVFVLMLSAWFIAPTINYAMEGRYKTTGTPHAFLMAKFIENGIVDRYLTEHCDSSLISALPDSGLYYINTKHNDKFWDVRGISKSNGALVHQWVYTGADNQLFYIVKEANGYYKIISKNSNKCIETSENDTLDGGATIVQNDYQGKDNQLFRISSSDIKNNWFILSKKSGKPIGLSPESIENGIAFHETDSTGSGSQQFRIVRYPYCLCLYKDALPNTAVGFLWTSNSIFSKTGSWWSSKNEYEKIINELVFSPKYIGSTIGDAFISTIEQLTRIDVGDGLFLYDQNSSPYLAVEKYLRYELKPYNNSKQNRGLLNFNEINKRNFAILLFSLIVIIVFCRVSQLRNKIDTKFIVFIYFTFLAILCNAFVTGAFANVLERLQCRVVWLIPLVALILVFNYLIPKLKNRLNKE
jgi:hypothetical protein